MGYPLHTGTWDTPCISDMGYSSHMDHYQWRHMTNCQGTHGVSHDKKPSDTSIVSPCDCKSLRKMIGAHKDVQVTWAVGGMVWVPSMVHHDHSTADEPSYTHNGTMPMANTTPQHDAAREANTVPSTQWREHNVYKHPVSMYLSALRIIESRLYFSYPIVNNRQRLLPICYW